MSMTKTYEISEMFYSIQGEGTHAGTPAVFIRFARCNLKCSWCDTDFRCRMVLSKKQVVAHMKQTLDAAGIYRAPLLVITGGEPMLQYDAELHEALLASSRCSKIAIETNGTISVPYLDNLFVTCSPKLVVFGPKNIQSNRPDEVKVVLDPRDTNLEEHISRIDLFFTDRSARFVQPCWSHDAVAIMRSTELAVSYVMRNPRWKLSLQTQKLARFA